MTTRITFGSLRGGRFFMIKRLYYKIKYSSLVARNKYLVREIAKFISYCLSKKKILILSDNRIISIPISSQLQIGATVICISLMLWISYTTSKYFAYGDIISQKDRELWTTSVTNENLKYQMADLHNNLEDLNKYFIDLEKFEQLSDKISAAPAQKNKNDSKEDKVSETEKPKTLRTSQLDSDKSITVGREDPQRQAQKILLNINNKVQQRIASIEGLISSTGVPLTKMINNHPVLKQALDSKKQKSTAGGLAQGGPFIPVGGKEDNTPYVMDKAAFSANIRYLLELEKTLHTMPIASPLKHYYITSHFGRRKDPLRKTQAVHLGLDMVGKKSARIYCSATGKVAFAGMNGAYGRFVEIDHGFGISTRYGHLSKILVKEGDEVKKGQVVGLQGSSGRSTGSHLHYEVRFEDRPLDPYQFLKVGQYVF